jgi:SAM-dependent methyltransferase
MSPETVAALQRINLDFYERHAAAFSATREGSWPGWRRVAEAVEERLGDTAPRLSVLDLGCGNGRLARFLEERWQEPFDYLGVDASGPLLDLAAARDWRPDCRFMRRDLLCEGLPAALSAAPFDLIAVFGLMHHLPGAVNRLMLLEKAAGLLAPGGLLAVSFWQFGDRDRFRRRVVSWEQYNRTAEEPIDMSDLEVGDTLLAWGEQDRAEPPPVRYCCWTSPLEADRLLAKLPLEAIAVYIADGAGRDLNLYRLLRSPAPRR